ncbi:cache domain-containing protein [Methanococcus voltae]|uniref:histidine kinase n=1 Tax=Methanococcus voltae (strain ATCC BAA-1334 / A3) TaxID=456320 RepID=D7DTL6_METV3|nr:cache domain-containing protein [Methanococcus voltae]MCS3901328.1 signal transduction histidine kinase [Methanococcus voltae]
MKKVPLFKRFGTKLLIYATIVAIIPIILLSVISNGTISNTMQEHSQNKINSDLKVAENILNNRLDEMDAVVYYSKNSNLTKSIIYDKDEKSIYELAISIKQSTNSDFVTICDANGNSIGGSNTNESGYGDFKYLMDDNFKKDGHKCIELINEEILKEQNVYNSSIIKLSGVGNGDRYLYKAMGLVSAQPVYKEGKLIGSIIAVDILNKDNNLVDKAKEVSGEATTIFLNDIRISTNVKDSEDKRAIGTIVSEDVYKKTLLSGETYYGKAFVVNEWYFTAYDPIKNFKGEVIGMLFVGTPVAPYEALNSNIKVQTVVIAFLGLIIAMIVSIMLSKSIIRPMENLKEAAQNFSEGRYGTKVPVDSLDEFGELSKIFNKMSDEISISHTKLQKHAQELSKSYDELKELDNLKSDLIAIASHELRTPLTSVKGYVELVLDGTMGEVNEAQSKCLSIANDNIDRLRRLIDSMLDLSKIERGELQMQKELMNMKVAVDEVFENLKPLFDEKNIRLVKDVQNLSLYGDKDRLMQVITNLVENAIKFNPTNGEIYLGAYEDEGNIHLIVQDHGAGIPEKDLEKIFDRFYQVDSSSKRPKGGSGLGLAVCKSIVEAHEGIIWVESELGKGSTFHVILPIFSNTFGIDDEENPFINKLNKDKSE